MKEPWASVLQGERLEQPLWDTQFLLVYSPWPARLIGSASAALTVRPWAFSSSFEGPTPCGGPCFSQWQRLQRSRVQRNKQNTHEGSRCQGKGNCLTILAWRPQGGGRRAPVWGDWEEALPSTCSPGPTAGGPHESSMAEGKRMNQEQVAVAAIFHTRGKNTLEMAFAAGCCWWCRPLNSGTWVPRKFQP